MTLGRSAVAVSGLNRVAVGVAVRAEFADITDQVERKIRGIALYESQIDRLFTGRKQMADAVRSYATTVSELGGSRGFAERYWVSTTS